MQIKTKTAIFTVSSIVLFFISWIVYDIYAMVKGGTEATISFFIYEAAYKYPIAVWFTGLVQGVLVGHFFWRIRDTKTTKRITDFTRE